MNLDGKAGVRSRWLVLRYASVAVSVSRIYEEISIVVLDIFRPMSFNRDRDEKNKKKRVSR
jgi:hypothetical protein